MIPIISAGVGYVAVNTTVDYGINGITELSSWTGAVLLITIATIIVAGIVSMRLFEAYLKFIKKLKHNTIRVVNGGVLYGLGYGIYKASNYISSQSIISARQVGIGTKYLIIFFLLGWVAEYIYTRYRKLYKEAKKKEAKSK